MTGVGRFSTPMLAPERSCLALKIAQAQRFELATENMQHFLRRAASEMPKSRKRTLTGSGPTLFSLPRNSASGYEGTQAAAVVHQ